MGHERDRCALAVQLAYKRLHASRLTGPERRGWLVQHYKARPPLHRSSDCQELSLAPRQRADRAGRAPEPDAEAVQDPGCFPVQPGIGSEQAMPLPAEEQVGGQVEVVARSQVLP